MLCIKSLSWDGVHNERSHEARHLAVTFDSTHALQTPFRSWIHKSRSLEQVRYELAGTRSRKLPGAWSGGGAGGAPTVGADRAAGRRCQLPLVHLPSQPSASPWWRQE